MTPGGRRARQERRRSDGVSPAVGERRLVSTRNSGSIQEASRNCFLEDRRWEHLSTGSCPLVQKVAQGSLLPTPELSSGFRRPWEKPPGRKTPA